MFYSIIGQFKEATGAMQQMSESAGELEQSYSIYMDSAQAKINQFKAAFEELSTSVFSSDAIGDLVDIGSGILNIVNMMAKANTLLPTIVASIGAIKAYKLSKSLKDLGAGLSDLTTGSKIGLILTAIGSIVSLVKSVKEMGEFFGWWSGDEPKTAARAISDIESELKQLNETAAQTSKNFKSLKDSATEIIPRYVQLAQGVDKFGKNVSLSSEQYSEYLTLNNKLAEMFPSINMGMDSNGNAMLSLSGNAEQLTDKLNELVEAQRKVANQEIASKLPDAIKDIEELNERVDRARAKYSDLNIDIWKAIYEYGASGKYSTGNLTTSFSTSDYGSSDAAVKAATKIQGLVAEMGIKGHLYSGKNSNGELEWHINWDYENFDPERAKQIYEDGLTQNERIIEDANERIKERWKSINPLVSAWLETDINYSEMEDKAQNIAKSIVSGLDFSELNLNSESDIKRYITDNIIKPLQSGEIQKAMDDVNEWEEKFKDTFGDKTVFGNIDTNNRQVIEWTDAAIEKNKEALSDWVDDIEGLKGTVSTILGTSAEYDGLEIAFSPILQTPDGAELLSADTVDKYISTLLEKLKSSGEEWTTEDLLKLDTEGIEIDGKKIKGLIADVGNTARETGEAMHFAGKDGALSKANELLDNVAKSAGVSREELLALFEDAELAAEKTTVALTDLSDSLSNLKTKYEVITKAQEEMFNGSISEDTVKAIKDAIGDDKSVSYLDFLYEENGILKLNIEKWKEYSEIEINKNKESLKGTIKDLYDERSAILARIDALNKSTEKDVNWQEQLSNEEAKLNSNTAAIEANQNKLALYEGLYDKAVLKLDAYTQALDNFKLVADKINNVSDALTTVADVQDKVKNGFTITLEEALKFAEVYPEILNSATATADGQIKLNQGVVNSFISSKEAELKAEIQTKIEQLKADKETLTAKKEFAEAQLKIAQGVGTGESKITADAAIYRIEVANQLVRKLVESGQTELQANKTATEAMGKNYASASNVAGEAAWTIGYNMGLSAEQVANQMRDALIVVSNNFGTAGSNSAVKFTNSFNSTAPAWVVDLIGGSPAVTGKSTTPYDRYTKNSNISLNSSTLNKKASTLSYKTMSVNTSQFSTGSSDLDNLITELKANIESYTKAISQNDGQIAALQAILNTTLNKFSTAYKNQQKSSDKSSSDKSSSDSTEKDNWFIKEYNRRNHLINMEKQDITEYLTWLEKAYKQAYKEELITLDDYYKYTEEIFNKRRELFEDYLNDVEHEISMRGNYNENKKILSLYKQLMADVENQIKAARAQGLKDTDEYIQNLQSKWMGYKDAIAGIEEDITKAAESSVKELVDIRIEMLKQDIKNQKDALSKQLDLLKEFYQKQKDLLKEQQEEDNYIEEQTEKRKAVSDIQDKLNQLEYDNSAWAQKRKLELAQELTDAQTELNKFEKEHAIEVAEKKLDELQEIQEKAINDQIDALDKQEEDTKTLYERALEDIKNGSIALYNEMIQYNNTYGDGIEDTIKTAWEDAYKALSEYKSLYDKTFNGVNLQNATNYTAPKESWNSAVVSGGGSTAKSSGGGSTTTTTSGSSSNPKGSTTPTSSTSTPKTTSTTNTSTPKTTSTSSATSITLDDNTKKMVAAAIWNGTMGWGAGKDREKRLTEVFGSNNGIQALVNKGVGKNIVAQAAYSYANMRKKYRGYASGTSNATLGLHGIDELGTETIFQSKNGNKYMMFTGGEKVLTAKASDFLYQFANRGAEMFAKLFGGSSTRFGNLRAVGNIEINAGDIIVNGNADKSTVSEIRRAQRDNIEAILKEFKKLNK